MTRRRPRDSQVGKLVLLGLFVVVLMVILSWSFRVDRVLAGSFRLDDFQICEELDEDMTPVNPGDRLPGEARQICLWFQYSRAREGDFVDIVWRREGSSIQKETFRLGDSKGARAFFLLKQDGSEFPPGAYSVAIHCNGREKATKHFVVDPVSGDLSVEETTEGETDLEEQPE